MSEEVARKKMLDEAAGAFDFLEAGPSEVGEGSGHGFGLAAAGGGVEEGVEFGFDRAK